MKFQENCGHCGSVVVAYTHNLNVPMVMAFCQLVEFYLIRKIPANLQNDLALDKNQYNNFQKLQYFGIVKRTESGWLPTEFGLKFYYNRTTLRTPVATMNGITLPDWHEAWETARGERKNISITDVIGWEYKRREDYQEEKSSQQTLFGMKELSTDKVFDSGIPLAV